MLRWISVSLIIHAILIFGYIDNIQKPKPNEKELPGQEKSKQRLIITFVEPESSNSNDDTGGYEEDDDGQAETYVPNDSCAWDSEEATKRWEEYQKEQDDLRQQMLKEQEEGL